MRPSEFELKFEIHRQDIEALLSRSLVGDRGATKHLCSTYFDTEERALRRRGLTLRVRRADGPLTTQTLKQTGASKIDRDEWEFDSLSKRPDRSWLRSTPPTRAFKKARFPKGLKEQFTVDVERSVFPIVYEKSIIEGALDQGVIIAGGVSAPVSEFEIELKSGRKRSVRRLARRLASDVPLVLSLSSKSGRGFSVADLTHGQPTSSLDFRLARKAKLADAFEATVQGCLELMLTNAALIGADCDGEAIHQARIALRRLRAVLHLFRPCLRRSRARVVRRDLKWIAGRLGDVRDIDVLIEGTFRDAGNERERLTTALRQRRSQSHADLRHALASPRWRLLLLSVLELSISGVRSTMRDERFRAWARKRVIKRHAVLADRIKCVTDLSAEKQHDVRKAAKALRYNLDVCVRAPGFGGKRPLMRLRSHLHDLQDELGALRDQEIMRSFRSELSASPPPLEKEQDEAMSSRATKAARRIRRTAVC